MTSGTAEPGDYIALAVADTGCGIRNDIVDRIFDPFFTTKDVGIGTGLGLSLVHGIAIDLAGAIDVESEPGRGSTFTIFLPVAATLKSQQRPRKGPFRAAQASESLLSMTKTRSFVLRATTSSTWAMKSRVSRPAWRP